MYVKYNPVSTRFKSVVGGVCVNEKLTLSALSDGENLSLAIRKDGGEYIELPAKKAGNCFSVDFYPEETGLYFYRFKSGDTFFGIPSGGRTELLFGNLSNGGGEFMLTVFSKGYFTPERIKGGVIYQIFPDRFFRLGETLPRENQRLKEWGGSPDYAPVCGKVRNDDFFGGTLEGITSSLDYLRSLGVTLIYLNPIFEARSNHRYDTGDYMKVDGLLGTEEDLIKLFKEAESLGIGVVLDGVFNHTGDDSLYFNKYKNYPSVGAYNSKRSKYFDWYNFRSFPDDYESWWGVDTLPQTNESSPAYQDFICGENGVLRHYLRLGASGWRLDVVDELPA
ncbi:MAG: glycoside hydrolase family 13 protein, partial [Clostridia bacterium]|nr:glycoside hydrolase family 13 protein [Clostridia bacterium]